MLAAQDSDLTGFRTTAWGLVSRVKFYRRCETYVLHIVCNNTLTPEHSLVLGNTGSTILLGDIISDEETLRFITQDPRSRNAITYPHSLWPRNTVPYIIDSTIGK